MLVDLEGRTLTGLVVVMLVTGCAQGAQFEPEGAEGASSVGQPLGQSVTRSFLTHCGVEALNISGRWWNAVTPLYGPGGVGSGPPAGWTQPSQSGQLTVETSTRARFEALGQVVLLTPSETGEPLRACR